MNYLSPSLAYVPSTQIVRYIEKNPISWSDRELAKIGGPGDKAGVTPTPAVGEFLCLFAQLGRLFTQDEYADFCFQKWQRWLGEKSFDQTLGVRAKLFRNFYPAMIDSLHVWAMACESYRFESCQLSALEDVIGKSDLVLWKNGKSIRLALLIGSTSGRDTRSYKLKHRPHVNDAQVVEMVLPMARRAYPGRKRWYTIQDLYNAVYGLTGTQKPLFSEV